MMNPAKILDTITLEWLLENDNPSVRYFTLTKLLQKSNNSAEVLHAKEDIMKIGAVPAILSKQNNAGNWGSPLKFYTEKYYGTVWQMIILAELNADQNDPRIKKACEFILENSQDPESYAFSMSRSIKNGGGRHSEIIPCLTGNMLWSLIKLGYQDDERVQKGVEWICRYQRCDDGDTAPPHEWPYDKYEMCWGKHSCHMGVVKSLKALSALPEEKRGEMVNVKIGDMAEYMLIHHIYKKSHNLRASSKPGWKRAGFPLMYQTDILEILCILTDLGYRDKRMADAVEIIKNRQNPDKKWLLENSYNDRMVINIEEAGNPSKWITARALYVLINQF